MFKNIGLKGKHKIANKWKPEVYLVVGQKDPSIPVYQIQKESGTGRVHTVHRNLLLPIGLPLHPDIVKPIASVEPGQEIERDPLSNHDASESDSEYEVKLHIPAINQASQSEAQSESENEQSISESEAHSVDSQSASPTRTPPNRPVRNRLRPAWMNSGDYVLYSQYAATSDNKDLIVKVCMSFLDSNNRMFETMMKVINSP